MLRARECRGAQLLADLGLSESQVRSRVMDRIKPGKCEPHPNELPYTSRAKKVLELTMAAARDPGDPYIGTQHLLLGLLNEERGIAAHVLLGSGVTPDRVRAALAGGAPVPSGPRAGTATPPSEPRLRIEIDDRSDRSIYEQIAGLLRPAAVAAFHMGSGAEELRTALEVAMGGIFDE